MHNTPTWFSWCVFDFQALLMMFPFNYLCDIFYLNYSCMMIFIDGNNLLGFVLISNNMPDCKYSCIEYNYTMRITIPGHYSIQLPEIFLDGLKKIVEIV